MTSDQSVAVQIHNQTYQLSSEGQGPEHIQRIAAYLDGKMRSAGAAASSRSPLDLAILAALEIAEEVVAERRRKASMLDEVDERISGVTRRLEDERRPPAADPSGDGR
jgi:cell division protein ZapA